MYDLSHISPVWARVTDLVIERGEGCNVYTSDGTKYLDLTSGIGVTNTGHCHPKVVTAIQEQAAKALHAQVNCYFHEPLIRLSQALNEVTPSHLDCFFFSNSGAEAVEGSVKLARHFTGKQNIIVFQGSFHGRTAMTMAMTTGKTIYRLKYQPLPAGVATAPFPLVYRYKMSEAQAVEWALQELDMLLHTRSAPAETAAMIIEPVVGEGGYLPTPVAFLKGLRKVCDGSGILLIVDEVQSGFGRTGKFFAHEHAGIQPDIIVMAKGMGSGFPISGIAASRDMMKKWIVGAHGGTYGGNPVGCAAAEATIRVIREEGLIENAAVRGKQLLDGLRHLQKRYPVLDDVRGLGLMVGCEFMHPDTGEPGKEITARIVQHAFREEKLLLLSCGPYGNVIRWVPPLIVTEAQITESLEKFGRTLEAVVG